MPQLSTARLSLLQLLFEHGASVTELSELFQTHRVQLHRRARTLGWAREESGEPAATVINRIARKSASPLTGDAQTLGDKVVALLRHADRENQPLDDALCDLILWLVGHEDVYKVPD